MSIIDSGEWSSQLSDRDITCISNVYHHHLSSRPGNHSNKLLRRLWPKSGTQSPILGKLLRLTVFGSYGVARFRFTFYGPELIPTHKHYK